MSPLTVSLPSPQVVWTSRYMVPLCGSSGFPFDSRHAQSTASFSPIAPFNGLGIRGTQSRNTWLPAGNPVQSFLPTGYGARGGAIISQFWNHLGRCCIAGRPNSNITIADGFVPPDWKPDLRGTTTLVPAGSRMDPGSVVAVFDVHLAAEVPAAPTWADDLVGVHFLPRNVADASLVPGGPAGAAAAIGGFGIFYNNSGAATTVCEYVSWSTGGTILERIRIPLAVVPDPNIWNTFRFVIVSARPGQAAQLQVQANAEDVVSVRTFGSALLQEPGAALANGDSLAMCHAMQRVGGVNRQLFFQHSIRVGAYTPTGQELQGQ